MADTFADNARRMQVRGLAVQGAVAGLFFAQMVAWQQFADTLIVRLVGAASDDPLASFVRALAVTATCIGLTYLITCCVQH
jgi:hypothetical protein